MVLPKELRGLELKGCTDHSTTDPSAGVRLPGQGGTFLPGAKGHTMTLGRDNKVYMGKEGVCTNAIPPCSVPSAHLVEVWAEIQRHCQ